MRTTQHVSTSIKGVTVQGKFIFLLGVAAGYVVGTRVGRQGYEDLKKQATAVWHDPRVQHSVATAGEFARDKIPVVGGLVGDAAHKHLADDTASNSAGDESNPKAEDSNV